MLESASAVLTAEALQPDLFAEPTLLGCDLYALIHTLLLCWPHTAVVASIHIRGWRAVVDACLDALRKARDEDWYVSRSLKSVLPVSTSDRDDETCADPPDYPVGAVLPPVKADSSSRILRVPDTPPSPGAIEGR
jgi:hypothetical protein